MADYLAHEARHVAHRFAVMIDEGCCIQPFRIRKHASGKALEIVDEGTKARYFLREVAPGGPGTE